MKTPMSVREIIFTDSLIPICTEIKSSIMNGEFISEKSERVREYINKIFEEYSCNSVIFTNNTDKLSFGIRVNPTITDNDLLKIIIDDNDLNHSNFTLEIDLSIFNYLNGVEVASYIVEEIATIMNPNTINNVRAVLDYILSKEDTSIEIRQSINYSQILTFGIKDTINKIASLIYKDEDGIGMNEFAQAFDIKDILGEVAGIVKMNIFGEENVSVNPSLSILKWCMNIYKDVQENYSSALEVLETAKQLTGSVLERREIEKTLQCIKKAYYETISEAVVEESVRGFSLFKSLKMNGLRSIEDDLYEYKIRIKNCEEQEEALYILRQINTRISILEDYLENTPDITESDYKRWKEVINCYRILRSEISKKKIGNKKSYGIFIDYDKIDQMYK